MVDVLTGALGVAAGYFVKGYLSEKAKNRATLEDIAEITRRTEAAKEPFSDRSEQLKHSNALRMASLDQRLAAHQEAFRLWRKLHADVFGEHTQEVVLECDTWWSANCLYLEPGARSAFAQAYWAAQSHSMLVDSSDRSSESIAQIKANYSLIKNAGNEIMRAVSLPELNPLELRPRNDAEGNVIDEAAVSRRLRD